MSEYSIKVDNVSKHFKVFYDKGSSLKDRLVYHSKNRVENRVVLNGISLEIKKGESIGLVGHNGCGKSTLLKLMTRILYPDSGSIDVKGRVSSLLELGAGFHPDLSGRENIYTNASIFGLSRKEIDDRLEDIISFSELGEFIDNPVRTYSSGMYMRLAFSVAINVDADVLLIDEILAVGDQNFQIKCFEKLQEIRKQGTTIVIVSHSLSQIEEFCDRSIWVHDGKVREDGPPIDVHRHYLSFMKKQRDRKILLDGMTPEQKAIVGDSDNLRWGSKIAEIVEAHCENDKGETITAIKPSEPITFVIKYKINQPIEDAALGIGIYKENGMHIYGTNTIIDKFDKFSMNEGGECRLRIGSFNMAPGEYLVSLSIEENQGEPVDYWKTAMSFNVEPEYNDIGFARFVHSWSFSDKEIEEKNTMPIKE